MTSCPDRKRAILPARGGEPSFTARALIEPLRPPARGWIEAQVPMPIRFRTVLPACGGEPGGLKGEIQGPGPSPRARG